MSSGSTSIAQIVFQIPNNATTFCVEQYTKGAATPWQSKMGSVSNTTIGKGFAVAFISAPGFYYATCSGKGAGANGCPSIIGAQPQANVVSVASTTFHTSAGNVPALLFKVN